ncbi:hypothetical protein ACS2Q8_28780, partial [Bacillus cereus group sp. Bce007]|uniref:hypothetical protein n=1 Tax=Bacillus cereus group sp. Bce007 TaxID=3445254 RepID=UPI003F29E937
AYLSWTLTLKTSASETDVRAAFEFVEADCTLTITPLQGASDEADNQINVDSSGFDLSAELAALLDLPAPIHTPAANSDEPAPEAEISQVG